MSGDALLVYTVLAITVLLFASDRMRLDVVALLALLALSITGILTPAEALAGFSDPVVVMIAGLFVVGGALFRTGVAERVGRSLGSMAGTSRAGLTAAVMLGSGVLSGFMSSTGTVAVMLPVTAALAWNARISPSLLLIPLSVGSLFGGLLTLIGTAPNIVVSNQLLAAGHAPLRFLDFTPIGIVTLAGAIAVMALFGARLLPARASAEGPASTDGVTVVPGEELVQGWGVGAIARLRVAKMSPLVGQSPAGASLRQRYGANVLAIRRAQGPGGRRLRLPGTSDELLQAGDEIDVQAPQDAVVQLCDAEGLEDAGVPTQPEAVLAEVLLTPRSRLIGRTLADVRFRTRYGANVLSVRRQGELLAGPLADVELRFADTLLVAGAPRRIELLRGDVIDFVVVAQAADPGRSGTAFGPRQLAAAGIMVGMMGLLTFELIAPVFAVMLAAVAMVLARCINMEDAYRSINWQSVVLIAAFLPMATALQKTGGMDLFVGQLQDVARWGPLAMMAALFLLTGVLSQFISNTATAVLVAPAAITAAAQMGVSPYPMAMAVAVAASSAMATPVATPVNMLVLGPGAYRFGDFMKTGLILQFLAFIVTLLLVPLLFPF
jgi:di/tricarboxylate transporter